MAWVQPLHRLAALRQLLRKAERAELRRRIKAIATDQHAALGKHSRRRQPNRAEPHVAELQPAIDVVVLLPEPPALPRNLERSSVRTFVDHLLVWRAQIVWNLAKHGERNRAEAEVRFNARWRTVARIPDAYAFARLAQLRYGRIVVNDRTERLRERIGNAVHAADRLEHRRLHVEDFVEQHAFPEFLQQERVQVNGLAQHTGVFDPRCSQISRAIAANVLTRIVERPIHAQERQHALTVFARELLVERTLRHTLRQQFADITARVILRLAHDNRFGAVRVIVLEHRRASHVYLDLHLHAQLPAVAEHRRVDRRQTRWTEVLIVARIPSAALFRPVRELHHIAAAHRPVASTGAAARLQQRAFVAERTQLIRGDQPCNATAQYDNAHTFARTWHGRRSSNGAAWLHQPQSLHGEERG